MDINMYGIPNCNTVKKAKDWLTEHKINFTFHDFKKIEVTKYLLNAWIEQVGWEILVNKKGTTWRQLEDSQKEKITNQQEAIKLMIAKPSVIKRPVIETKKGLLVGFDEDAYNAIFN